MSRPVSTTKVKNFRRKIKDLCDQELDLRAQIRRLYDQFVLDVGDDELALRHVRQAYFHIQKYRLMKLMEEKLEFHPFFSAHPASSIHREMFEEDEDDDGIL